VLPAPISTPCKPTLKTALDLASGCHRAYLQADDHTRRLLNQALFKAIYIDEDGVRAELTEPFKTLLGPEVLQAADRGQQRAEAWSPSAAAECPIEGEGGHSGVRHNWSAAYIRRIRAQAQNGQTCAIQQGAG
jgi:hypothetical protein